jgi:hypothetical protein
MIVTDWNSFVLGVAMGVAGWTITVGFIAALFAYHASEADKRGLSYRSGPPVKGGRRDKP